MKWVHTGKEIADPLEFGFQKQRKRVMYKRRGRVGDKFTTLFLYYWKMGNLFLGHFLLTGNEIPKKLQFLKFGES